MPVHQARFFLFDGEEVAVYAEREATQQIRDAMEGLLGLSWLRELADHLRKNARTPDVATRLSTKRSSGQRARSMLWKSECSLKERPCVMSRKS
jgi:hypothetical protein